MHLLSWEVVDGHEDNLKIRLERYTNVSNYAILSHRWDNPEDEVSYEDMLTGREEGKNGYKKLVSCCKQARRDGLHHVWIDTCCINKASSAELSEAITSMFTYYEQSKVCYVFLNDFLIDSSAKEDLRLLSFSRSIWFTRGWTLQELIAPPHVKFFDASWSLLGWKTDKSLSAVIESVTKIDSIVLNIPATTKLMSISKKMSWAAQRKTTRIEDMAYSLTGIFGVYMPPLYGEGNHAFIRLQEAIMKTSNDHTIFAWTSPPVPPFSHGFEHISSMLALSPDQFKCSANFKPFSQRESSKASTRGGHKLDFAITNAGLAIRLPLKKIVEVEGLYAAFLSCSEGEDRIPSAILLRTTTETPAGHFWRTNSNEGPIERRERRWFPMSGRESTDTNDIYVLPRFTSISGDNIEPSWSRGDIANIHHENAGNISLGTKKDSFVINTETINNLRHVPDPSFNELASLRQAHHLISTNQADQLFNMIKTRLRFPKTLPLPRNKRFYGRTAILQKLKDLFFLHGRDLRSQDRGIASYTISGMAGIGKTEVALEFSYDCIENHLFDAVIWISGESIMEIHDGFQRIAFELKLAEQGSPAGEIVHKVLQWLSDFDQYAKVQGGSSAYSVKWLLVFDNVDNVSLLNQFWPSNGPGCVLVTSRDSNLWFTLGCEQISLEPFTIQESSELFGNLTRLDWDFTSISERLGGHPLAINQAAAVIVRNRLSVEQFVSRYDTVGTKAMHSRHPHGTYKHTLATVLSSTLSELSPSSHRILQVISFLDPDFIQDSVLISSRTVELEEFPQDELDLLYSWEDLLRCGLIKRSSERDGLQVHRLIQSIVRERMDPDEFQKALSTAVALVSSAWIHANSSGQGKLQNLKIRDDLLPHVVHLKHFATKFMDTEDGICTQTDFAKLLSYVEDHFAAKETPVEQQVPLKRMES